MAPHGGLESDDCGDDGDGDDGGGGDDDGGGDDEDDDNDDDNEDDGDAEPIVDVMRATRATCACVRLCVFVPNGRRLGARSPPR